VIFFFDCAAVWRECMMHDKSSVEKQSYIIVVVIIIIFVIVIITVINPLLMKITTDWLSTF
jgi:hypothetical protein